jgi:hypothetical protein
LQRVEIVSIDLHNTASSYWDKISLGVPQGFILASLPFLMYIKDMCKILSNISIPVPLLLAQA